MPAADSAMTARLVLDLPKTRAPVALLLRRLPLYRRTKVVDVGANPMAADAAHSALLKLGGCDVVGFEPQPAAFEMLAKIKSERESYYPFAIGDGRRGDLRVYQDHDSRRFWPPICRARKSLPCALGILSLSGFRLKPSGLTIWPTSSRSTF